MGGILTAGPFLTWETDSTLSKPCAPSLIETPMRSVWSSVANWTSWDTPFEDPSTPMIGTPDQLHRSIEAYESIGVSENRAASRHR